MLGLQCDAEQKSENELIEMLSVLFSKNQSAETKRKKLETNHGIKTTKEYDEVIDNMCNISRYYTQDYDEAMQKLQEAVNRASEAETRADEAETRADEAETRAAQVLQDYMNLREENARLQEQLRKAGQDSLNKN